MTIIKKYTAIQLATAQINRDIRIDLSYGEIRGPYYDEDYPKEEFDSEEDTVEYAFQKDEYARWLILPLVKFKI